MRPTNWSGEAVNWADEAEKMAGLIERIDAGESGALETARALLTGISQHFSAETIILLLDALREEYLRLKGAQES